jgi:hypothetical protein
VGGELLYNRRDRTVRRKPPQTATTSPKKKFLILVIEYVTSYSSYTIYIDLVLSEHMT